MGLLDRERRLLPGEYDLDLERERDLERLLEERDRLRLLLGERRRESPVGQSGSLEASGPNS